MPEAPEDFFDAAMDVGDVTTDAARDFRTLLQRVREGSEDAAWELIDVYGPHIFRAVRRRLHVRMRPKFDSADFVQAVWASFFTSRSEILSFNKPEELIAFLAAMAQNKVISEVRRRMIHQKHNIFREEPLRDSAQPAPQAPVGHQATPSQVAVARERWKKMVAGQPMRHKQILALRYMGETYEGIAKKVGMHERTVRRIVEQALDGSMQR